MYVFQIGHKLETGLRGTLSTGPCQDWGCVRFWGSTAPPRLALSVWPPGILTGQCVVVILPRKIIITKIIQNNTKVSQSSGATRIGVHCPCQYCSRICLVTIKKEPPRSSLKTEILSSSKHIGINPKWNSNIVERTICLLMTKGEKLRLMAGVARTSQRKREDTYSCMDTCMVEFVSLLLHMVFLTYPVFITLQQ